MDALGGLKETLGMSHPVGYPLRDRIGVHFVEADVEMAFNLVDMAETESELGNATLASQVIHSAEEVFSDIEQRLERLDEKARAPFTDLVGELRREIDLAKLHARTDRKAN